MFLKLVQINFKFADKERILSKCIDNMSNMAGALETGTAYPS